MNLKREFQFVVRLTAQEHLLVQIAAQRRGLTQSKFVRALIDAATKSCLDEALAVACARPTAGTDDTNREVLSALRRILDAETPASG